MYQWLSGSINFHASFQASGHYPSCGTYTLSDTSTTWYVKIEQCIYRFRPGSTYSLCESRTNQALQHAPTPPGIRLASPQFSSDLMRHVQCSSGHSTHVFLSCDPLSQCLPPTQSAASPSSPLCVATLFACQRREERVPYTLVCDFHPDCSDGSDEDFCVYEPCGSFEFQCSNRQVLIVVCPILFAATLECLFFRRQKYCI